MTNTLANTPHPAQTPGERLLKTSPLLRWRGAIRSLGITALLFSLLVAVFMSFNYRNLVRVDPLQDEVLARMRGELLERAGDEALRNQIRELDLMIRKVYFLERSQLHLGAWLLGGGLLVALSALHLLYLPRRKFPDLSAGARRSPEEEDGRRAYQGALGAILFLALAGGMVTVKSAPLMEEGTSKEKPEVPLPKDQLPPPPAPSSPLASSLEEDFPRWPSFRGQNGGAQVKLEKVPAGWNGSTGEGILFKVKVPRPGFSSPVVWRDQVFLTGADRDVREVYAFSLTDGALRWSHRADGIPGSPEVLPEVTDDTGYAAPTVAVDGERLFALFATGDLLCLSLAGERLWAKNLGVPENHYGHSSSLLAVQGLLLIQYDHGGSQRVMALAAATGANVWETARSSEISWASPVLQREEERTLLILSGTPAVAAYDLMSGSEIWRTECLSGEVGPSPALAPGRVFVANETAMLVALESKTGKILWQNGEVSMPDAVSPVAAGDYLLIPTAWGVLSCVRASDGHILYEEDLKKGSYASPILVNDRVYLTDLAGLTRVIEAGEAYREVGQFPLGEGVVATPAFVEGLILIRGLTHLYGIGGVK